MSELLPCPFCGGEAQVMKMDLGSIEEGWQVWGIWCVDDLHAEEHGGYQHGHFIDNYATEAEAIEAWNTRKERTCHDTGECRWFCCSECGFGFNDMYANKEREFEIDVSFPKYCPNCGAKVIDTKGDNG